MRVANETVNRIGTAAPPGDEPAWASIAAWRAATRRGASPAMPALDGTAAALYAPLMSAFAARGALVVAHLGQSLDGRIATQSGASRWITGEADLLHTHRMRALADAVIVGAGTVAADDPLLTVRRCEGENPVRVVIDAGSRLAPTQKVFNGDSPTLHLIAEDAPRAPQGACAQVRLPATQGRIAVGAILGALRRRGLAWIFVEGGGVTVSQFLAAGALDRLQLVLAPVLLGSGRPSLVLPEIADPGRGLRPASRRIELGEDILVDCVFR
jgi:riboflavin-specific deaminase-like protein